MLRAVPTWHRESVMKKIVCGFMFGLMLMVAGAQAWAGNVSTTRLNKTLILADQGTGIPPVPNPKFV
jgi:hypothetical protein